MLEQALSRKPVGGWHRVLTVCGPPGIAFARLRGFRLFARLPNRCGSLDSHHVGYLEFRQFAAEATIRSVSGVGQHRALRDTALTCTSSSKPKFLYFSVDNRTNTKAAFQFPFSAVVGMLVRTRTTNDYIYWELAPVTAHSEENTGEGEAVFHEVATNRLVREVALSWRQCAEYYLREVWYSDDRHLVPRFSASEVTCEVLHDLCVRYSVARTIPGYIEELGVEGKYGRFADMLNKYRDTAMTKENVPGIIDREAANMREQYGSFFFSAISKAFWMMKKHPVVIYDSFAFEGLRRLGLEPGYNTYREYFDSWFRFFEQQDTKDELDEAADWLQSSLYAQGLLEKGYIHSSDLDSAWLRNRVADIRLCVYGGSKWLSSNNGAVVTVPGPEKVKFTYTVKVGDVVVGEWRWNKADHIARCLHAAGAKGITIYGPASAWNAKQKKDDPLYAEVGEMKYWPYSKPTKKTIPELKLEGELLLTKLKK